MIQKSLRKYQQLPIIDVCSIKNQESFLLYDELIIDYTHFSHPGSQTLLSQFQGADIRIPFQNQQHSLNACLMLMNLAIGRENRKGKGSELWEKVEHQEIIRIHERALSKLDFSKGIIDQFRNLETQELKSLVIVPKTFDNSKSIKFFDDKWKDAWYRDRFWLSTFIFTVLLAFMMNYLQENGVLFVSPFQYVLFGLGVIKWTGIEYYFHRFKLHYTITQQHKIIEGHYLHHAFPNLKNKIALSVTRNIAYEIVFFFAYQYLLQLSVSDSLHLLMGLHLTMILYDCLHYYFHFGPQLNLPIISALKKSHLQHHYRDMNRKFGVTNTVWDKIFKTD